jgi:hypothetical protein
VWELHKSGYPHLHVVARAGFIPQKWLSERWDQLGIGCIVDIRKVYKHETAAFYISKYLGKAVGDCARMLRNTRIISKSRNWLIADPEVSDLDELKGWTWAPVSAELWQVLADFASCGASLISRSLCSSRALLSLEHFFPDARKANLDALPLQIFTDPEDP